MYASKIKLQNKKYGCNSAKNFFQRDLYPENPGKNSAPANIG